MLKKSRFKDDGVINLEKNNYIFYFIVRFILNHALKELLDNFKLTRKVSARAESASDVIL